mmetsp:Transcript_16763/g.29655  ORF Transcript_16763/g.29655 Transcript_16763/m.29655 type:complete len:277 (-) Transcript_16763:186-1016(-)
MAFISSGEGKEPANGDVLMLPAVGIANVGQMAIDLVLNTLLAEGQKVERIGWFRTRNVLPMVGNDPLDFPGGKRGKMCVNVEVFRVEGEMGLCFLQIRAPVVEGCMAEFSAELAQWASQVGFKAVYMFGGADSASGTDEEVMISQFRFIATDLADEMKAAAQNKGIKELAAKPILVPKIASRYEEDMGEQPQVVCAYPVTKAGLFNPFFNACQESSVPLLSVIIFCKEGNNIPEACLMAGAICSLHTVFMTPPSTLTPPLSWIHLDGANPELSLFM